MKICQTKDLIYVLLMFSVNIPELFLRKIIKILQLVMLFKKLNETNWKQNEKHNSSKFYNRSVKSWLQNNNTEM